jgi:hypothetical protein
MAVGCYVTQTNMCNDVPKFTMKATLLVAKICWMKSVVVGAIARVA